MLRQWAKQNLRHWSLRQWALGGAALGGLLGPGGIAPVHAQQYPPAGAPVVSTGVDDPTAGVVRLGGPTVGGDVLPPGVSQFEFNAPHENFGAPNMIGDAVSNTGQISVTVSQPMVIQFDPTLLDPLLIADPLFVVPAADVDLNVIVIDPATGLPMVDPITGDVVLTTDGLPDPGGDPILTPISTFAADLPMLGHLKISENNSPIPRDRVYLSFNQARNAYSSFAEDLTDINGFSTARSTDLHRYTLGIEKTFFGGHVSVEGRLPLIDNPSTFGAGPLTSDSVTSVAGTNDEIQNAAVNVKAALFQGKFGSRRMLLSAGIGVDIPTGDGVFFSTSSVATGDARTIGAQLDALGNPILDGDGNLIPVFGTGENSTTLRIENDATIIAPFIAALIENDDNHSFLQAFLEVDAAAGGNTISDPLLGDIATFRPRTQLQFDIGGGRWLYRDKAAPFFTGIAPMLELHYTATLDRTEGINLRDPELQEIDFVVEPSDPLDPDSPVIADGVFTPPGTDVHDVSIGSVGNSRHVVNLTLGMNFEIMQHASTRVAAVLPLRSANNGLQQRRDFDASFLFQFDLTR